MGNFLYEEVSKLPHSWSKWTKSEILKALDLYYAQEGRRPHYSWFSAAAKGYPLKALKIACLEAHPCRSGRHQEYRIYRSLGSIESMKDDLLVALRDCDYSEYQIKRIVEQAEIIEKKENEEINGGLF